jgi:hypothetical protein
MKKKKVEFKFDGETNAAAALPHPGPLPLGEGVAQVRQAVVDRGPYAVGMKEAYKADSVTIETPGSSVTYTRQDVEMWLHGMNIVRRMAGDEACRQSVAITINNKTAAMSGEKSTSALPKLVRALAIVAILFSVFIGGPCDGSEIIRGYAPVDGQQLYAADLDNLVDESTIGVQFYNDQQTTPVLGAGYYFLILNPANQTYYRLNAQQVLYGNTNFFINAPLESVPGYGLMLFYDPTNGWVASTTVSNFLWNSASNINVAGLSFANTNNGGATNAFVLARWPYPGPSGAAPNWTNYPAHFLIFDTNGIPYREGMSNLDVNVAFDLGTVYALPYEFEQEFAPWRLYGTNTAAPYTNAFGWQTNFPITAYFQTNISGTNLPTLTDNDTIPINSTQQGVVGSGPTNTAASLLSIYEYMTNKNALPPYTIARIQFAGVPDQLAITNMDSITGFITNVSAAIDWSNSFPVAVSWAGEVAQIPTVPSVQSNTLFYAVQTNNGTAPLAFQLYTNLATALTRTTPITGNGVNPTHGGTLYWITNVTCVNADVIQTVSATSLRTGVYDVYFRTPAANALYYLSGMCLQPPAGGGFANFTEHVVLSQDDMITTNFVRILTEADNNNAAQSPLNQVLIQPQ